MHKVHLEVHKVHPEVPTCPMNMETVDPSAVPKGTC